jgi:hypothetical protein
MVASLRASGVGLRSNRCFCFCWLGFSGGGRGDSSGRVGNGVRKRGQETISDFYPRGSLGLDSVTGSAT